MFTYALQMRFWYNRYPTSCLHRNGSPLGAAVIFISLQLHTQFRHYVADGAHPEVDFVLGDGEGRAKADAALGTGQEEHVVLAAAADKIVAVGTRGEVEGGDKAA